MSFFLCQQGFPGFHRQFFVLSMLSVVCLCVPCSTMIRAQGSAGERAVFESRVIVDMPTAGLLRKNSLGFSTVVFAQGGLLSELSFAPMDNFNIGIGYSGVNIIGSGAISWQGAPSMHLRYRPLDETLLSPAILIGLQTQGRGSVASKRFETAAAGLFVSASKQFRVMTGTVAFHAGAGYSLDVTFNGQGFNVWGGIEQSLGTYASAMVECNPTFNDSASGILLNASVRWVISKGVTLELQGRDILSQLPASSGFTRTLCFEINRAL